MEALQRGASNEPMVCVAGYLLGEYGRLLTDIPTSAQFALLQERFVSTSPEAKASPAFVHCAAPLLMPFQIAVCGRLCQTGLTVRAFATAPCVCSSYSLHCNSVQMHVHAYVAVDLLLASYMGHWPCFSVHPHTLPSSGIIHSVPVLALKCRPCC